MLFNGRPGYWVLQYNQLGGWTLLGQTTLYGDQFINGWLYPSVTIDCFYAASLLQVGAWSFFVFLFLYLRSGHRAVERKDCCKFVALLACAVFGFTEIHMIDFAICTPMLLLGEGLFCDRGPLRASYRDLWRKNVDEAAFGDSLSVKPSLMRSVK